ncbi:hypothetical protein EV187_0906 [Agromyces ramosus]|uniref:CDP-glycerol:poly(Glycerophosphate) glycerophosphotransferase n=1 Tax=Agromyces ramosus TaxID=33879 RepID=A0A4Q7MKP4_9MICO|nr:hypothetical protein [Agromyces ramosus]RZS68477.1 hypothetical protein EV187_0906 [Agromyces ramosus]
MSGIMHRVLNYGMNVLKMPGRVKELHEMTVESTRLQARILRELRDAASVTLERVCSIDGVTPWAGGPIRVVMLVHYLEAWASLEPVFRAMEADDAFEVTVASIPRRFPGAPGFSGEHVVDAELTARGVRHVRLPFADSSESLDLLRALRPHVVFRQSQWDADVPPGFSTRALSFARLCLVPYETMNIVENVRHAGTPTDTAVDTPYHRAAWRVFCANDVVQRAAIEGATLGAEQFVVTGHPKSIAIREAEGHWPIDGPRRPRIAWSAHHSIGDDWTRFGLFPAMSEAMLRFAETHPECDVVFLPHPMLLTFGGHHQSPVTQVEVDAFLERWAALPNTATYTGVDYPSVLRASDALITDGLSMLIEYQLLGKPLVFVERDGHRPFNDVGDVVVTGAHRIGDVAAAITAVHRFACGEVDPLRDRQAANVADLFPHPDPDRLILDAIRTGLSASRLEA